MSYDIITHVYLIFMYEGLNKMITLSEAYRKLDNENISSRHLNEADYVTLGNIKLPTDMTGMDDNTSYQDAAKIGQRLYDKEQARLARVKAEQEGASLYAKCEDALKSSPDNVDDTEFDGAHIEQWAADAFTIDNLTKDGLDELEDNMDRWLADGCRELIEENQDMLNDDEDEYDDDYEDEDDLDENLNRYSRKRRITEAEDKKYALGTLVAKHMKEINSITNKNELIDFVSGLKNQVSDQTYLTREVIPNLQRKNFVAGLQYIMNIALKGEKKGSIEKEFSRKSTKRNSRRRVNEAKRSPLRYYFRSIKKSLDYEDVYDFADDLDNDYPDLRLTWLMDKLAVMFVQTFDGENGPFSKNAICDMDTDLYEMLTKDLYINVDYYTSIIYDLDNEQAEEFDEEVDNTMQRLWRDIRTTIWYSQELLG